MTRTAYADHTYMAMLRNAANDRRSVEPTVRFALKTRDGALRDVLTQAERLLASVHIDATLQEEGALVLRARDGARGVDLALHHRTEGVTLTGRSGGTIAIRWNVRAFQWDGRKAEENGPSEPAWYTVAKTVVDELACASDDRPHHPPVAENT